MQGKMGKRPPKFRLDYRSGLQYVFSRPSR
jgi:hypothetical protein